MDGIGTPPTIFVVDDEEPIRRLLDRVLSKAGMTVKASASGKDCLSALERQIPDLLVLDVNLPDTQGTVLCRQIRENPKTRFIPILILTGNLHEGLSAECLEGGADDYVNKPFDNKEFVARIHALLRRPKTYVANDSIFEAGPLTIYVAERRILMNGRDIPSLAPKEFDLLLEIVLHAPQVVSKRAVAMKVWGLPLEKINNRTLDVHIRRIREKLGEQGQHSLKTVPAVGFQWLHPLSM